MALTLTRTTSPALDELNNTLAQLPPATHDHLADLLERYAARLVSGADLNTCNKQARAVIQWVRKEIKEGRLPTQLDDLIQARLRFMRGRT